MKRFLRNLIALIMALAMVMPLLLTPISAAVADSEFLSAAVNTEDKGLTIDNHTESDGVNYADDFYQLKKKLEEVPHTYQAWVNIPSAVNSSKPIGTIFGNYRSSGIPCVNFTVDTGNSPTLVWYGEDTTQHKVSFKASADDADGMVVPYGQWTQITIVHDDEEKAVHLYINGELYGTNTANYAVIQQASAMRLTMNLGGDNRYWNTRYFKGALSDVAIYSDSLTAEEVKNSYNNGVDADDDKLIAFYDIDSSDMHTDIADASGNGYDLQYSKLWLTEEEMNDIRKENGMIDENGNYTYAYSFAVVGDPQYVTRYYPENLPILYQWIVDNKDAKNIQYVVGVGDITDTDSEAEWLTAKNAISIMDGIIDYSLVRGNHDVKNGGALFDYYFANDPDYTKQFETYGGFFEDGSVENTYRTLTVGDDKWLFLNFDWGPSDEVIDWAIDVVASHPDYRVVISTHGYVTADGSTIDASDGDSVDPATRNNGDQIWTKLASQFENVELVLCGHISMDNIIVTQNTGVHGNTVTQMLIDPQRNDYCSTDGIVYNQGGACIVTMLYFDENGTQVNVEHYSTIRERYYKTCNQLTVDLDAEADKVTEYWDGITEIEPDGSGTKEDPYLITNAANLYWISNQIKNTSGLWDGYCVQMNDIDIGGFKLPSLGGYYKNSNSSIRVFGGVYDGNGYTIKNGTIVSYNEGNTTSKTNFYSSGLFGKISGATIKNLTLDNISSETALSIVGVLVGSAEGPLDGSAVGAEYNLIENCTVTSSCKAISSIALGTNSTSWFNTYITPRAGGIAGALAYTTVRNCTNEASVYMPANQGFAGGIVGSLYGDSVIDSCVNNGTVTIALDDTNSTKKGKGYAAGGIVGSIHGVTNLDYPKDSTAGANANTYIANNVTISNCINNGDCVATGVATMGEIIALGGILGLSEHLRSNGSYVIYKCTNNANVAINAEQSIDTYVAGIVGFATQNSTRLSGGVNYSSLVIANCTNAVESLANYNQYAVSEGSDTHITTEHSYADKWTDNGNGTHIVDCECEDGDIIALPHRWNQGEVTLAPSHMEVGTMTYICMDCGVIKTEEIENDVHAHSFGAWESDGDETHSSFCECGLSRTYPHASINNNGVCDTCGAEVSVAPSNDVCKIGDVGYATLDKAIAAVKDNETILVLKSATLSGFNGGAIKYTIKGDSKVKLSIISAGIISFSDVDVTLENLVIESANGFTTGENGTDAIGTLTFNNCDITIGNDFRFLSGSTVNINDSTMKNTHSTGPMFYFRNNRSGETGILNVTDSHLIYAGSGAHSYNSCVFHFNSSYAHVVNIKGDSVIETRGNGGERNHIAYNQKAANVATINMDDSVVLYLNPTNPTDASSYFLRGASGMTMKISGTPTYKVNSLVANKGFKFFYDSNIIVKDKNGTLVGYKGITDSGKDILLSGVVAAGVLTEGFSVKPVYMTATDFDMIDGASLRTVVGENGIRFSTTYSKSLDNILNGKAVFGTLISPTKLLGSTELTLENAEVLNATAADSVLKIVSTKKVEGATANTYHAAIIMNPAGVAEKDIYSLELAARGYMTVTYDDGTSATFYTAFDDENIRSMHKVAENLYLKHNNPNDSYTMSDETLAIVNNIIDKVGLPLPEAKKTLSILAIGNSFSIDAMEYLWQICNDAGYDTIELGNLYIGGCSLDTHWSNILNNKAAYTYYQNTDGTWTSTTSSANDAIKSKKWDVITIQQASNYSGVASSYSNLNNILDYIEANTPSTTKVLWHMTWAYQGNSTHSAFPTYGSNQTTMYNAIVGAVNSEILTNDRIDGVIPSGTAIQNLRTSYFGDTLTRDGYHLSYDYGRYTAALTWFAYITGEDIANIDWVPSSYPNVGFNLTAIKEAVSTAIASPFEVTQSTNTTKPTAASDAELFATNGLDISDYYELSLNMTTNRFYNSTLSCGLEPASDVNSPNFSATDIFTKEELPVGSVIIVDSGYRYRPDGWIDADTKNTSRPGNETANFTVVDDAWWGSYTLRAFNLSKTSGAVMTEADNVHLRIYVPVN